MPYFSQSHLQSFETFTIYIRDASFNVTCVRLKLTGFFTVHWMRGKQKLAFLTSFWGNQKENPTVTKSHLRPLQIIWKKYTYHPDPFYHHHHRGRVWGVTITRTKFTHLFRAGNVKWWYANEFSKWGQEVRLFFNKGSWLDFRAL